MSYRIDQARQWVVTTAWGILTDDDLLAHKTALARDPQFNPEMCQISDISGIERLDVTATGVRAMVAHDGRHADRRAGHRMALVVPKSDVYGMARMYQLMSANSQQSIGVFREMTEAMAWLVGNHPQ